MSDVQIAPYVNPATSIQQPRKRHVLGLHPFAVGVTAFMASIAFTPWTNSGGNRTHADAAQRKDKSEKQKPGAIADFAGVSPDFKTVATWNSKKLSVLDYDTRKSRAPVTWETEWVAPFAVTFGGERLAAASVDSVKVFSIKDGELISNYRGFIDRACLCQDGKRLLVVESKGLICHLMIQNLDDRDDSKDLQIGSNGRALFQVSGDFAATHAQVDEICIVEISAGRIRHKIKGAVFSAPTRLPVQCLAVSSDGKTLAVGIDDKVKLFDLAAEKVTRSLEGHLDVVTCLTFHPENQIIASASKDKTIRFWSVKNGKEIHKIKGLSLIPSELKISSDGGSLAFSIGSAGPYEGQTRHAEISTLDLLKPDKKE